MSDPFIGEIRMFGGNFAPAGWAMCQGQLLDISQNEELFNLIGTTYGGDGQETFALPDLRGRAPVHQGTIQGGQSYVIGAAAGVETVTLTVNQLPVHTHALTASSDSATAIPPTGAVLASPVQLSAYYKAQADSDLNAGAIGAAGGSQPHANMQRYLVITFIIALAGIFPSQG
jgi:microcystin-dependent protein